MTDGHRATYKVAVTEALFRNVLDAMRRLSMRDRKLISFHSAVLAGCRHLEHVDQLEEDVFGDCATASEHPFCEITLILKADDKTAFFRARDYLQSRFNRRISSCETIAAAISAVRRREPL